MRDMFIIAIRVICSAQNHFLSFVREICILRQQVETHLLVKYTLLIKHQNPSCPYPITAVCGAFGHRRATALVRFGLLVDRIRLAQ